MGLALHPWMAEDCLILGCSRASGPVVFVLCPIFIGSKV